MSQVAVAGLLTVLVSFLDVRNSEFLLGILPGGTECPLSTPNQGLLGNLGTRPELTVYSSGFLRFFGPHETPISHIFDLNQRDFF